MGISVEYQNQTYRFLKLGEMSVWLNTDDIAVDDDLSDVLTALAAEEGFDPETIYPVKEKSKVAKTPRIKQTRKSKSIVAGITLGSLLTNAIAKIDKERTE